MDRAEVLFDQIKQSVDSIGGDPSAAADQNRVDLVRVQISELYEIAKNVTPKKDSYRDAKHEARRALRALYLEVPREIAADVEKRVNAAFNVADKIIGSIIPW